MQVYQVQILSKFFSSSTPNDLKDLNLYPNRHEEVAQILPNFDYGF